MITPGSTQSDLKPVLRESVRSPIDITVGNPFVPTARLLLSSPGDRKGFKLEPQPPSEERSSVHSPRSTELLSTVRDSHLRFARVDLSRRPTSPSLLDNLGTTHLNRGDLEEAEKCFKQALELKPDFLPSLAHLAKVRLVQGRPDEAAAIYQRLHGSRPDDPDVVVNLAAIELQRGNIDAAIEVLTQALDQDVEDEHILNTLGVARLLRRDVNGAVSSFRKALRENARFLPAQNNLGATYMVAQHYARAERALKTSLTLDKGNAAATKNLAELYIGRERYAQARSLLEAYLQRDSTDVEARGTLAFCLLNLGDYPGSIAELAVAIKNAEQQAIPPTQRAALYNNLGVAYQRKGDADRAQRSFETALDVAPKGDRKILFNLMNLHAQRRNVGHLREFIDRASILYPEDGRVDLFRSRYYALRGDYSEAMKAGRAALEAMKDSVEAHAMVAAISGEIFGDYQEAIRLMRDGLRRHPQNRMLQNNLAYYLLMEGDIAAAREILDNLVEDADDVHLRATRGLLLMKEGNIKEGTRLYNEAWRRAQGGELKSLVTQKKTVELARIAIANGRRGEAEALLRRAIAEKSGEAIYRDQARNLLNALRTGSDRP